MASVIELVKGKTFKEVKEFARENLLDVKENEKLYMLSFTEDSDLDKKFIRQANGIILEKETNKLVHHCFEKAYDGIFDEKFFENCNMGKNTFNCNDFEELDYSVEHYTEGILIRVYWYDGKWDIGSSRKINAALSKWGSDKTIKELFYEALEVEKINLEFLDRNYCHTFLLQHPSLKVCLDSSSIFCSQLNRVNLETLEEERLSKGYEIDNKISNLLKEQPRVDKNYIIYLLDGSRINLLNDEYKYIKNLMGNHSSFKWRYLDAIKSGRTSELRKYFKTETPLFDEIDARLFSNIRMIHDSYIARKIKKDYCYEVYHKHEKSITQLHAIYKKYRKPITLEIVEDLLLGLKLKTLHWVLNL